MGLVVVLVGCVIGVSAGPVSAAGNVIFVPPAVVQTPWREPLLLTKDGRKRFDPVKVKSKKVLSALKLFTAGPSKELLVPYERARAELVSLVAARVGVSRSAMLEAWKSASFSHQLAVVVGLTTLGVGYEFGSDNPRKGLDCSGLVAYAWRTAGVELPLQSKRQWQESKNVSQAEAQAGDVVWYPGHTMIYLGVGDAVLHSARPGAGVRIGLINWREAPMAKFGNPQG